MKKSLTLTIVANMTSNYGETLGNISTVHKYYSNGRAFGMVSKERLKSEVCEQCGLTADMQTVVDKKVTQKDVSEVLNAKNCRALEAGYMNTISKSSYKRNSSFYFTDAISCDPLINEVRFHNNLRMATYNAKEKGLNLSMDADTIGLMPYQYEYDKALKVYSLTIDLDRVGKDKNFNVEAEPEEKATRVKMLLDGVRYLSLVVKGSLDDASPLFVVGGMSSRRTHVFENLVKVHRGEFQLNKALKERLKEGYKVGLYENGVFTNEAQIIEELSPISVDEFFDNLYAEIEEYYGVN